MESYEKSQLKLIQMTISSRFSYDPLTGDVRYLIDTWSKSTGDLVNTNRRCIQICEKLISLAKVMWFLHYGEWFDGLLDHKDRDWGNNRISNLRKATATQNQQNKAVSNPHGYKGVTWRKRNKKPWLSKIRVNGKRVNLGSFATKEQAAKAYEEACLFYHGEFACLTITPLNPRN